MENCRIRNTATRFCLILLLCVTPVACSDGPRLQPLDEDAVILAFGDSLTYGTGGNGTSYPGVLQQLTGLEVINAGIPGETSAAGLKRLPALLERHQPSLLILCHGGNDILRRLDRGAMQRNLETMATLARERGIDVVFIGVPEFSLFLDASAQHDAVARRLALPYLADSLPDILGKGSLKADRIHPNAQGYRQLANDIHDLLVEHGALTE